MTPSLEEQSVALEEGRGFVELAGWRLALVGGGEAVGWLNDLITADISGLARGRAARSLLLSPTGRIRADFTVARIADGYLLVQHAEQPAPVATLLAPYVLSSDVSITAADDAYAVFAFAGPAPDVDGAERYAPSALGVGTDLVVRGEERVRIPAAARDADPVSSDAAERWRIRRGIPRFPVDLREDSLPHEAGLDDLVAFEKGCFLGQEAVAKVRNLGRPPFVVVAGRAQGPVAPGDALLAGDAEVGVVTSATDEEGSTALLARVRWRARDSRMRTSSGIAVDARPLARAAP